MVPARTYIPRSDLGFPDRRRDFRFELSFTDEADAEQWERERSDGLEFAAANPIDRAVVR